VIIRGALGDGRMLQGIEPIRKVDVQLGIIHQFVTQRP
jgi:hypothetical protein